MSVKVDKPLQELCIKTMRTLAIDAINKANSGHPGAPMALAPAAFALWSNVMKFNPRNPRWVDRDRFVLSNGHASMLLYATLFLNGFELSLEEIKKFRQWGSGTPGHPEVGQTAGVETTTGPLGQGLMNAVGMAMAEAHLAEVYNRDGHEIVNHFTYVFCGDGDLMEGASHEAASFAGHLGLGKLIALYDDNRISIEGATDITYSDNVQKRFESYNWHVIDLGEKGNDVEAITTAFEQAQKVSDRPTMIILRTRIGFGSPNRGDTPDAHGSPLGAEETLLTKQAYDWPEEPAFLIPDKVEIYTKKMLEAGAKMESNWQATFNAYGNQFPELAKQFEEALAGETSSKWQAEDIVFTPEEGALATRIASGKVINSFAPKLHWFLGGSADLAPSNKTTISSSDYFTRDNPGGRNIAYGVRELGMCAAASGISLHGGARPFVATFFVFTDYARPAIRLAALMDLPVVYVMTHDSVGVGEDGPTHQPIEHLNSLRMIPNLTIIRPADANETAYAWQAALENQTGPTMLILTRQGVPTLDRKSCAAASGLLKGAYILSAEKGERPDLILIATGSEVQTAIAAQKKLSGEGVDARVVSMPSWELFEAQTAAYRNEVLPPSITRRISIEAGMTFGWQKWVGDNGVAIGIDRFGASAPAPTLFEKFGVTVENIIVNAKRLMG